VRILKFSDQFNQYLTKYEMFGFLFYNDRTIKIKTCDKGVPYLYGFCRYISLQNTLALTGMGQYTSSRHILLTVNST